jgi:hypothetical protein
MADPAESILRDELKELHAYAREFFRIQILWIFLVGLTNMAGLTLVFAEKLDFAVTAKPPLCVGFILLNLATAVQCIVRRIDYRILGNQIDEASQALTRQTETQPRRSTFPLQWCVRTTTLYTVLAALLSVGWMLCMLHVWRHEDAPAWEYQICLGVLVVVGIAFGVMLRSQVVRGRRQLEA